MSAPTSGDRRTREDYLAAAADQLARSGPLGGGRQLKISAVTAAAGTNRSALYRIWPSIHELCDDLAIYASCDVTDWRRLLLRSGARGSVGATVAQATEAPFPFVATSTRLVVASVEDQPVRRIVAETELDWFRRFGSWLDDVLAASGRRPLPGMDARSLAVIVTAVVDGSLMQVGMGADGPADFWTPTDVAQLAAVVDRLVDQLTEPGPVRSVAVPGPGEPPEQRDWTDRQRHVFHSVIEAVERVPFDHPDAPMGPRLVDLAALARQLDVSERRMYQLWPTSSELNAELFTFQVRRVRAAIDDLVMAAIVSNLEGAVDFHRDVVIGGLHAALEAGAAAGSNGLFASTFSLLDPAVSAAAATEIAAWREGQQMMLLAGLSVFGFHLRAGVRPEPYTEAVFSYLMGAMRLAQMNPALRDETVGYGEGTYPTLAVGGIVVFRSLSDECTPPERRD